MVPLPAPRLRQKGEQLPTLVGTALGPVTARGVVAGLLTHYQYARSKQPEEEFVAQPLGHVGGQSVVEPL